MNNKQLEITMVLFKWNINKPCLPQMKPCIMYDEFEAEYEKFLLNKKAYLEILDAEFEKYPIVKCEMHDFASKQLEDHLQEVTKISAKKAVKILNPLLSHAIKRMHKAFHSMLSTQEQVLGLSREHSLVGNRLLDIKNEELMKMSGFIHSANLYASDMLDIVFKELIDLLDRLEEQNKENKKLLVERFESNIKKYESLSAGLGLEGPISVICLDDNDYCLIKDIVFRIDTVSNDFNRIWSLL